MKRCPPLCRRAITYDPKLASIVTLNSFQGPSSLTADARMIGGITQKDPKMRAAERGAEWTLKQVQGDAEPLIIEMQLPTAQQ